jgi:hypothetical protein
MATTNHGNDPVTGVVGNGSNSCNLYYQDPNLSSTAAQALELTLIGETESPLTADEVIVVKVPVSALRDSLVYKKTWAGPVITTTTGVEGTDAVNGSQQSYPFAVFRPKVLVDAASNTNSSTALGRFLKLDPDAKAQYMFTDDSGDNSLWTLQSYFANEPFTYSDANAATLSQIPAESVKSVVMTAISAKPLVTSAKATLGASNFSALPSAVVPNFIKSTTANASSPAQNDYALDLFQQADAAGKVAYWYNYTDSNGTVGGSSAPTVTSGFGLEGSSADYRQVSFVEGDSITLYVTYNMTKTKSFKLDGASGADAKYQIMGSNGTVVNVDNNHSMTSDVRNVVIAYQFMAGPSQFIGSFNASLDNFGVVSSSNSKLTWTISGGPLNSYYSWRLNQGSLSVEGSNGFIDSRGMGYFTTQRTFPAGAVTLTVTFVNNSTISGSANVTTPTQYDPKVSMMLQSASLPSVFRLIIANANPTTSYTWTIGAESGTGTLNTAGSDIQNGNITYDVGNVVAATVTFDDGTTKSASYTIYPYNAIFSADSSSWAPSTLVMNVYGGQPNSSFSYSINGGPSIQESIDGEGNYSFTSTDVYQAGPGYVTALFDDGQPITMPFRINAECVVTGAPLSGSAPSQVGFSITKGYPNTKCYWKAYEIAPEGYTESGMVEFDGDGNASGSTVGSYSGAVRIDIVPNANPGQSVGSPEFNVTNIVLTPSQVSGSLPSRISYSITGANPGSTFTLTVDGDDTENGITDGSGNGTGIIDESGNGSGSTTRQYDVGTYPVVIAFNDFQGQYTQNITLS